MLALAASREWVRVRGEAEGKKGRVEIGREGLSHITMIEVSTSTADKPPHYIVLLFF